MNDETRQVELKKTTGELKVAMHPYNPLIADVLYKTSYLESWGSGVKRIVEACRKQNVPDPEWSLRGGFVTVTFRREVVGSTQTSTQTNNLIDNVTTNPTDTRSLILKAISENPRITRNDLAKLLGISPDGVKKQISRLKSEGIIERIGPDFGGYWRFTEKENTLNESKEDLKE